MGIRENESFWTVEVWEGFLEEVTRPLMLGGCQHCGRKEEDGINLGTKYRAETDPWGMSRGAVQESLKEKMATNDNTSEPEI